MLFLFNDIKLTRLYPQFQ